MPVARQRHTKARRDRARVFYKLKSKDLIACPKCGYYKGKEVINTMKKVNKKAKK